MRLVPTVRLNNLSPQITLAVIVANEIYRDYNVPLVITSANDLIHMKGSKHYKGEAVDFRIREFKSRSDAEIVVRRLKTNLTNDFDIVLEKDHIHLEYDPK